MKYFSSAAFLIVFFLLTISVFAQNPTATPLPNEDILKISTTLIQVDVTVTDKKGNVVTDLKPEDFEVYENGKKQNISNFSLVLTESQTAATENIGAPNNSDNKNNKTRIPVPPVKLRAEKVRRTYALVVDDLGLSFENIPAVKQSLKKFVNEQMQEGDLVAVIRTGVGIGALQSFTSDKRVLLAAIDKIRWNTQGRGGINTFAPIETTLKEDLEGTVKSDGTSRNPQGMQDEKRFQRQTDEFRSENFSVGTLGALSYIIRGMRELPGRKAVMLFSEGFVLVSDGKPNRIFDSMKILADLANRSSVVFYTLDPRGLQAPGMANASDVIREVIPRTFDPATYQDPRTQRETDFRDSQQGLRYLAYETGGVAFDNQNNLNKGLQRAVDDQNSYYLLGYEPNDETFDPKKNKFNKLEVKLLRPDLKIRYRSGFFGVADEKRRQTNQKPKNETVATSENSRQTNQAQKRELAAAVVSPFGVDEINVNLYSVFYNDYQNRNFIRSFVYIDPKDLTFTADANGFYQAEFDIIAMIFDADGAAATNNINSQTLKFTGEQLARIREKGIIYDLPVPIIKPGAYQFRVALQDSATGKIGAASQFIELPNLAKKDLALSNLIVRQYSLEEWKKISAGQTDDSKSTSNTALLDTVTRRFQSGSVFTYSFIIYNAKTDDNQKPQLQMQARLFRNGQLILESSPSPLDIEGPTDWQRLEISRAVTLGANLQPGDYALQVIVSDGLARDKKRISSQSIDFEIVK